MITAFFDATIARLSPVYLADLVQELASIIQSQLTPAVDAPPSDTALIVASLDLLLSDKIRSFLCPAVTSSQHIASRCSGCRMSPISGPRYRCSQCINTDFCSECEATILDIHPAWHPLIVIPNPLSIPPSVQLRSLPRSAPVLPEIYPQASQWQAQSQPFEDLQQSPVSSSTPLSPTSSSFEPVPSSPPPASSSSPSSSSFASSSGMIHLPDLSNPLHRTPCSVCGIASIPGARFHCLSCEDYNLCAACMATSQHPSSHHFLKLRLPAEGPIPKLPTPLHWSLYPSAMLQHQRRRAQRSLSKQQQRAPSGALENSRAGLTTSLHVFSDRSEGCDDEPPANKAPDLLGLLRGILFDFFKNRPAQSEVFVQAEKLFLALLASAPLSAVQDCLFEHPQFLYLCREFALRSDPLLSGLFHKIFQALASHPVPQREPQLHFHALSRKAAFDVLLRVVQQHPHMRVQRLADLLRLAALFSPSPAELVQGLQEEEDGDTPQLGRQSLTRSAPVRGTPLARDCQLPESTAVALMEALLKVLSSSQCPFDLPLSVSVCAILAAADPDHLIRSHQLSMVLADWMHKPPEYQIYLLGPFSRLIDRLASCALAQQLALAVSLLSSASAAVLSTPFASTLVNILLINNIKHPSVIQSAPASSAELLSLVFRLLATTLSGSLAATPPAYLKKLLKAGVSLLTAHPRHLSLCEGILLRSPGAVSAAAPHLPLHIWVSLLSPRPALDHLAGPSFSSLARLVGLSLPIARAVLFHAFDAMAADSPSLLLFRLLHILLTSHPQLSSEFAPGLNLILGCLALAHARFPSPLGSSSVVATHKSTVLPIPGHSGFHRFDSTEVFHISPLSKAACFALSVDSSGKPLHGVLRVYAGFSSPPTELVWSAQMPGVSSRPSLFPDLVQTPYTFFKAEFVTSTEVTTATVHWHMADKKCIKLKKMGPSVMALLSRLSAAPDFARAAASRLEWQDLLPILSSPEPCPLLIQAVRDLLSSFPRLRAKISQQALQFISAGTAFQRNAAALLGALLSDSPDTFASLAPAIAAASPYSCTLLGAATRAVRLDPSLLDSPAVIEALGPMLRRQTLADPVFELQAAVFDRVPGAFASFLSEEGNCKDPVNQILAIRRILDLSPDLASVFLASPVFTRLVANLCDPGFREVIGCLAVLERLAYFAPAKAPILSELWPMLWSHIRNGDTHSLPSSRILTRAFNRSPEMHRRFAAQFFEETERPPSSEEDLRVLSFMRHLLLVPDVAILEVSAVGDVCLNTVKAKAPSPLDPKDQRSLPYAFHSDTPSSATIVARPDDDLYAVVERHLPCSPDLGFVFVASLSSRDGPVARGTRISSLLAADRDDLQIRCKLALERLSCDAPSCPSCLHPTLPSVSIKLAAEQPNCARCSTPSLFHRPGWFCQFCSHHVCYDCLPGPPLSPTCDATGHCRLALALVPGTDQSRCRCRAPISNQELRSVCPGHPALSFCAKCCPQRPTDLPPLPCPGGMAELVEVAGLACLLQRAAAFVATRPQSATLYPWIEWTSKVGVLATFPGFTAVFLRSEPSRVYLAALLTGSTPLVPAVQVLSTVVEQVRELLAARPREMLEFVVPSRLLHGLLTALSYLTSTPHLQPALFASSFQDVLAEIKAGEVKSIKIPQAQNPGRNHYWVAGAGSSASAPSGSPSSSSPAWTPGKYLGDHADKHARAALLLDVLRAFLACYQPDVDASVVAPVIEIVQSSCFPALLEEHLRNDSVVEILRCAAFHHSLFTLLSLISERPPLWPLLKPTVYQLVERLADLANILQRGHALGTNLTAHEEIAQLASSILQMREQLSATVFRRVAQKAKVKLQSPSRDLSRSKSKSPLQQYRDAMKPLQFLEASLLAGHTYAEALLSESPSLPRATLRHLTQELGNFNTGLPLHPSGSIFVRVDSKRLDLMSALIIGPDKTPFAGGCFLFHIRCPPNYPTAAPQFFFKTSGGANVNCGLSTSGAICNLAVDAFPQASWDGTYSTILEFLISIQSLIMVADPYFEPPQRSAERNTEAGLAQSLALNKTIRLNTGRWAIIEPLISPPPEFADVIRTHYSLTGNQVLAQMRRWASQDDSTAWLSIISSFEAALKRTLSSS